MKKIAIITTIVLIIFFIMGCDKFNPDKYIGDWDFVTITEHYRTDGISGENVLIGCDTTYYLGTIYAHEVFSNQLIIQFTETRCEKIGVNKFGKISIACMRYSVECGEFVGEDRVHFNLFCDHIDFEYIVGTKRKGGNDE